MFRTFVLVLYVFCLRRNREGTSVNVQVQLPIMLVFHHLMYAKSNGFHILSDC